MREIKITKQLLARYKRAQLPLTISLNLNYQKESMTIADFYYPDVEEVVFQIREPSIFILEESLDVKQKEPNV